MRLKRLNAQALMIERCVRGFLDRQAARAARRHLNLARQRKVFAGFATVLQKRYRAFHSRKYMHDYYARKAYLAAVVHKGEAVRKALAEQMQAEAELRRSQADEQVRRGKTKMDRTARGAMDFESWTDCNHATRASRGP
jgi:hypothetical protein